MSGFDNSTLKSSCLRQPKHADKGLYAKEAKGELDNLIGVSIGSPFELPRQPDLVLDTEGKSVEECVSLILSKLSERHYR